MKATTVKDRVKHRAEELAKTVNGELVECREGFLILIPRTIMFVPIDNGKDIDVYTNDHTEALKWIVASYLQRIE